MPQPSNPSPERAARGEGKNIPIEDTHETAGKAQPSAANAQPARIRLIDVGIRAAFVALKLCSVVVDVAPRTRCQR